MKALSFEEAFAKLEATVSALQDGRLPLEEALQQYQEGMKLAQYCHRLLEDAELSVQQLSVDGDGVVSTQPLDI